MVNKYGEPTRLQGTQRNQIKVRFRTGKDGVRSVS